MSSHRRWSVGTVISATGIVYGDIGTSPLYALEQSLTAAGPFNTEAVMGVLSLIFWALAISVTLKYVTVIMRADNDGEGGILALFALAKRQLMGGSPWTKTVIAMALAGTAFFFCDALITPAISVLSAVEGMEVLDADFSKYVIPVTVAVLLVLFFYQRRGVAQIASLFGPVMIVWFAVLAVTGALAIGRAPEVLYACNPVYGLSLLFHRPMFALAIIGAVFLSVTGGEALYADMGHFGRNPVRIAWFTIVWPALIINYFGQGALLLQTGHAIVHPLYVLVPPSLLPWMVVLATAATVIASQATISGAFSMARQAVQLDLLPRIKVLQTSAQEQGQIYVPIVNWTVFVAVVLWHWPKSAVALLFGLMFMVDAVFVAGNMTKVPTGGWIPLTLSAVLFLVFLTWRNGRLELRAALAKMAVPRSELAKMIASSYRVPGTGVFLASDPGLVPSALIRNIEHNGVVHQRVIILQIEIAHTPRLDPVRRVSIEEILPGVYSITARFGFMETPDVSEALKSCRTRGLRVFTEDSSFFVGRHVVRARPLPGLRGIQRRLFARMQQHSTQAAEFFRMPFRGVVVLNTAVEI